MELDDEELNKLYPRLQAPAEELLHDLACDGDDCVYQRGLKIAEEFQNDTEENGRRRHAAEASASGSPVERQASGAAVARRHNRRRSARGKPASPATPWSSATSESVRYSDSGLSNLSVPFPL